MIIPVEVVGFVHKKQPCFQKVLLGVALLLGIDPQAPLGEDRQHEGLACAALASTAHSLMATPLVEINTNDLSSVDCPSDARMTLPFACKLLRHLYP